MTGFWQVLWPRATIFSHCEAKSVNHRYGDITVKVPAL
ncbi:MAG: hypothetical protein R2864_12080 [Syntrophotaleaceae bacterium]